MFELLMSADMMDGEPGEPLTEEQLAEMLERSTEVEGEPQEGEEGDQQAQQTQSDEAPPGCRARRPWTGDKMHLRHLKFPYYNARRSASAIGWPALPCCDGNSTTTEVSS